MYKFIATLITLAVLTACSTMAQPPLEAQSTQAIQNFAFNKNDVVPVTSRNGETVTTGYSSTVRWQTDHVKLFATVDLVQRYSRCRMQTPFDRTSWVYFSQASGFPLGTRGQNLFLPYRSTQAYPLSVECRGRGSNPDGYFVVYVDN